MKTHLLARQRILVTGAYTSSCSVKERQSRDAKEQERSDRILHIPFFPCTGAALGENERR